MSTGRRPPAFRSAKPGDVAAPPLPPEAGTAPADDGRPTGTAATARSWADALIKAALIAVACAWIYSPSLHGDWLWDDDTSVWKNPTVLNPVYSFKDFWVAPAGADYFPLTATGFWLQWHLFGPAPNTPPDQVPAAMERVKTAYHAVNIILHAAAALLLWRLMHAMKLPGGWLAGMLFAVHPIGVESVSWVSELKNTLCQPLFLLAAIHFVLFDDAERAESDWDSPRVWGNYVLALVCFLLAMLAKTSVVMFPVVILMYAWWKRGRIGPLDIVHSAPFFLVSLLLGLMTIYYQHGRAVGQEKMPIDGILPRFAIAGMAIPFYLWKTVWPFDLLPIYPQWQVHPPKWWQFLPWPLMAAALVWLVMQVRPGGRSGWARNVLFALGFFVLMLLPILGFITISYMRITWVCDHFLYLPMISLIMLGTAAAAGWVARAEATEQRVAVTAAAALVGLLAFSTFRYAHVWFNEDKQWTHTLASNPDAWQAHNRLGAWKAARGDVKGAHEHFKNSSRLRPDLGETHNNLGTTHLQQGNRDEAIAAFERAIAATPHVPLFRVNLLNALLETGRMERFESTFRTMLDEEDPAATEFLVALGQQGMAMENAANAAAKANRPEEAQRLAAAALGRYELATKQFRLLLEKHPRNAVGWNNCAVMLMKHGKLQDAVSAFERALEINPSLMDAQVGLEAARRELAASANAQPSPGGQRPPPLPEMQPPNSPTLGPSPLLGN
ncbi:MAG: tetratricopeptide repeat protein [Planctomycetia bacterium]|jgi:tetratricopeptide (TPR) repeat protein